VVCQRLDFLKSHQLRIPRCEVLTANIAAKGTIRAGQLSQIANVIQAGGEDGMWTFDRYQRWIEQKKDWARPPSSVSVAEESEPAVPAARPSRSNFGTARSAVPQPTARQPPPRQRVAGTPPPDEGHTEISIEEDTDLAELAKQIERRTP
jgi:twitching motility protein PilT